MVWAWKERKKLGIKYFGKLIIWWFNGSLVLIFLHFAVWLREIFSDIYQMQQMEQVTEEYAMYEQQFHMIGIVLQLISSIPAIAILVMLSTFLTSFLKNRDMEEYIMRCMGYTNAQVLKYELSIVFLDTILTMLGAFALFVAVFAYIPRISKLLMVQNNFHVYMNYHMQLYVIFCIALSIIVTLKSLKLVKV